MASYYVFASSGSDLADGLTTSTPWATLAKLMATVADFTGHTIYLKGEFQEQLTIPASSANFTIREWTDQPARSWRIGAQRDLPSTGWTALGGTRYRRTLAAGLLINAVGANLDSRYTATGRRYGYYDNVAGTGSAYSWEYTSGTGVLDINTGSDGAPNALDDGTWMYVLKDVSCVSSSGCTNATIRGGIIGPVSGTDASGGGNYGWLSQSDTNSHAIDVLFEDCGFHALGFVGTSNDSNKITGCTFSGLRNGTQVVYYSSGTDVVGGVVRSTRFLIGGYLNYNGTAEVNSGVSHTIAGAYHHTDSAGGSTVNDVEYIGCTFIGSSITPSGGAINAGDCDSLSGAESLYDSYPIRLTDCTMYELRGEVYSIGCNIAFRRCMILQPYAGSTNDARVGAIYSGGKLYMESCVVIFDIDDTGTTTTYGINFNGAGADFYAVNTTIIDNGTNNDAGYHCLFHIGNAAQVITARQCAFGHTLATRTNQVFIEGFGLSSANFVFSDTAVFCPHGAGGFFTRVAGSGFNIGGYSTNKTEWTSAEDATAFYAEGPAFISTTSTETAGKPLAGTSIFSTKNRNPTTHANFGILNAQWDGTAGAWQFGNNSGSTAARMILDLV